MGRHAGEHQPRPGQPAGLQERRRPVHLRGPQGLLAGSHRPPDRRSVAAVVLPHLRHLRRRGRLEPRERGVDLGPRPVHDRTPPAVRSPIQFRRRPRLGFRLPRRPRQRRRHRHRRRQELPLLQRPAAQRQYLDVPRRADLHVERQAVHSPDRPDGDRQQRQGQPQRRGEQQRHRPNSRLQSGRQPIGNQPDAHLRSGEPRHGRGGPSSDAQCGNL